MSRLHKLTASVYSAFDKSPRARIVARVRSGVALRWVIRNRKLTLYLDGPTPWAEFDLMEMTLRELFTQLGTLGLGVDARDDPILERRAAALISGEGGPSSEFVLSVYDSLLWSFLDAFAVELEAAGQAVDEAIKQLYLGTAEGEWLDFWGEFLGLGRGGRDDESYRHYLIEETLRLRSSAVGIEKAVKDATGEQIVVYEPWRDMFTLDESALGGGAHLQDGNFYTFNVIEPVGPPGTDWDAVMPVIHRNRPGGTHVATPRTVMPPRHVNTAGLSGDDIQAAVLEVRAGLALLSATEALSEAMRLSVSERVRTIAAAVFEMRGFGLENRESAATTLEEYRSVSKATVCLSDGVALGDINARFGLGRSGEINGPQFLSGSDEDEGYRLSDLLHEVWYQRFDEALEEVRSAGIPVGVPTEQARSESDLFLYWVRHREHRLDSSRLSDERSNAWTHAARQDARGRAISLGISWLWIRDGRDDAMAVLNAEGLQIQQGAEMRNIDRSAWASRIDPDGYWRDVYRPGRVWRGDYAGGAVSFIDTSGNLVDIVSL